MTNLKRLQIILICFCLGFVILSCNKKQNSVAQDEKTEAAADEKNGDEKPEEEVKPVTPKEAGYSFGVILAQTAKDAGLELNPSSLAKGFKAGIKENFDANAVMEAEKILQRAFQEGRVKKVEKKLAASKKFLEKNKNKEGIHTTESGLQYEILEEGSGDKPTMNDVVEVNYEGKLMDGKVFDSSMGNGPVRLELTKVIPGWTEGLQLMPLGAKYRFFIPPELAYGAQGISQGGREIIPPNETLTFEVELVSINPPEEKPAK